MKQKSNHQDVPNRKTIVLLEFWDTYKKQAEACLQEMSKIQHQQDVNYSLAAEQAYKNVDAKLKSTLDSLLRDFIQEANNGTTIIFPPIDPTQTMEHVLPKIDASVLKKMIRNQSNIHQVTFVSNHNISYIDCNNQTYAEHKDSLLTFIMRQPDEKQPANFHDLMSYALRNGADPNYMRSDFAHKLRRWDGDKGPIQVHEKRGTKESILHEAALFLDLKAMKILLHNGANPNLGCYKSSPGIFSNKIKLESGVLKTILTELSKKESVSPEFYRDLTEVVDLLWQKGIKLDTKRGNNNLNISAIKDPSTKKQILQILSQKRETKHWYDKLSCKKSVPAHEPLR